MKITELEIHILRAPDTGHPHWVSNFIVPRANEVLVRMRTDEGAEGIGIATSHAPIAAAVRLRSGRRYQFSLSLPLSGSDAAQRPASPAGGSGRSPL